MRLMSFCAAALLAVAGVVPAAAAGPDFPERPFAGGNVDPDWRVELKRVEAGVVELRLSSPRGVPIAAGTLKSVKPVLTLPVFGELKGQYGLAGPVIMQLRSYPAQLLVAPSKAGQPCQDARGKKYAQAVFLVIGAPTDPDKLYYGCGEYARP